MSDPDKNEERKRKARATQLAYRERLIAEGKCVQCWQPLKGTDPPGLMCLPCRVKRRRRTRKNPSRRAKVGRRPIEETAFDIIARCFVTRYPTLLSLARCRELVSDPPTRAALVCFPENVYVADQILEAKKPVKLSARRIGQLFESKAFRKAIIAKVRPPKKR